MQVRKCMVEGVVTYLVMMVEEPSKDEWIQRVLIVKEFPKVFMDDLLGLHPNSEMKFNIKLEPTTNPIHKAP